MLVIELPAREAGACSPTTLEEDEGTRFGVFVRRGPIRHPCVEGLEANSLEINQGNAEGAKTVRVTNMMSSLGAACKARGQMPVVSCSRPHMGSGRDVSWKRSPQPGTTIPYY